MTIGYVLDLNELGGELRWQKLQIGADVGVGVIHGDEALKRSITHMWFTQRLLFDVRSSTGKKKTRSRNGPSPKLRSRQGQISLGIEPPEI